MGKRKRSSAESEAKKIAHLQTQRDEGFWLGETRGNAVTDEVIRRYNAASETFRGCPHLQQDPDQVRFWVEAVPELIACQACTAVLAAEEQKRRNSCCVMCGEHVELRGMSVATSGVLLRAGICKDCEVAYRVLDQSAE